MNPLELAGAAAIAVILWEMPWPFWAIAALILLALMLLQFLWWVARTLSESDEVKDINKDTWKS